jgi:serine/threonine-protein kinase
MPIASGGMAMVWAARLKGTRGFQKIVAVKTMLPKLSDDVSFEQMFLDEASHASQVRHPHVVEILDLGEQDGVLYLVMEWIHGVPLNQIIKAARDSGGIPLPIAVRIATQACAGLHAAHELRDQQGQLVGLVHRDVSPQNLLVTYDGVTKVVDFGVAKATAIAGGATQAGQLKGKVAYMSPEQVKGQPIDRRTDVFAMGIVLYAMTTGRHPFRKESEAATLYQICSPTPAPSPRKFIPSYPLSLERVVLQALAKDPSKRIPTADSLLVALDRALPASMRLSSDQEVAKYVNQLFADKRDRQRAELQAALERADQRAQTNVAPSLREVLDSQPPPSRASISGVSGVGSGADISDVSTVSTVAGAPPQSTGISPARADQELPLPTAPPRRRALWVTLAVCLLALSGAAVFVLLRAHAPAKVTTSPSSTAQATAATARASVPSAEAAPPPTPQAASPPEKSAAPEASAAPGKPRRIGGKWPIGPAGSAKEKPPGSQPPATPGLNVDKVFE